MGSDMCIREIHIHRFELERLNKKLSERNINLFLFRGNHDNPLFFNRIVTDKDRFMMSNVKVLPDYTVLTINGINVLIVGGGISVDRLLRIDRDSRTRRKWLLLCKDKTEEDAKRCIPGTYWEDEAPILNTDAIEELTNDGFSISACLTHVAPSFVYPFSKDGIKHYLKMDSNLAFDTDKERITMDAILNCLMDLKHPLKEWIYGHYHCHHEEEHDGIKYITLINSDTRFDSYEVLRLNEIEI